MRKPKVHPIISLPTARSAAMALVCICMLFVALGANAENRFTDATTAVITLTNTDQIRDLILRRIDIDKVVDLDVHVYLLPSEFETLTAAGYNVRWIPNIAKIYADSLWEATKDTDDPLRQYHSFNEIRQELYDYAATYPSLCRVDSIGASHQGRGLFFIKISDNVNLEENEPELKYISTMHGDEPPGTEMCLYLIDTLLTGYGVNSRLTDIVNSTELWIMPMMNPDGYIAHSRYNAQGVDLNRDFPDRIEDSTNTVSGRATETQVVMNWAFQHSSVLSINYHTGALVANYPFDGNAAHSSVNTPTPEDDLFIHLALTYSTHNLPMYNGSFPQGITNGADWYVIYGGMQDWNYVWMGDRELTVELSSIKWPSYTVLPGMWENNRESMLSYIEQIHRGIKGIVTDSETGDPVAAAVRLNDIVYDTYSDPDVGDYYRILLNGTYDLTFSAEGYYPVTVENILVSGMSPTVVDVQMTPLGEVVEVFFDDFSSDLGWIGYGGAGEWTRGNPMGGTGHDTHGGPDPTQDHTPGADNNVIGNDLTVVDGDYEPNILPTDWITSPIIDCSDVVQVQLEFWRWLGVERNDYDHAYFQVYDGTTWVTRWENGSTTVDEDSWTQHHLNVSEEADENAQFCMRFGIGNTDDGWEYCGWNIDDVKLYGYSEGLPAIADITIQRWGASSMRVVWSSVSGALNYRVYRGSTPDFEVGPASLLIEIAQPDTSHVDAGVLNQMTNAFYRVTACD